MSAERDLDSLAQGGFPLALSFRLHAEGFVRYCAPSSRCWLRWPSSRPARRTSGSVLSGL